MQCSQRGLLIAVMLPLVSCAAGQAPIAQVPQTQPFSIADTANTVVCEGNYARKTVLSASGSVNCQDGRTGTLSIATEANGQPTQGTFTLADGTSSTVNFKPILGDRHAYGIAYNLAPLPSSVAATSNGLGGTWSPRVYTGNCPTPDSLDAAGRRCGARSAASRSGGYDGYRSWASAAPSYGTGSTYVRGHYRAGRWVRGYHRRR